MSLSAVSIPDLFRAIVAEHPDRPALRDGDRSVTYREIDAATNGVARRLLELDDERPLLVVAPLDIPTILVLFGAVKAGRLVVPLDPRWPRDQWLAVARDTHGRLVVPDEATRSGLPDAVAATAMLTAELFAGEADDPHLGLDPDAPAFVFFTSGSTGAPKGTVLTHRPIDSALDLLHMTPDDRLALVAPLSFITGALAAVAVLLTGGSGHLCDVMTTDPSRIARWLADDAITLLGLSPTILGMIGGAALDAGRPIGSLRLVVHGGETGTAEHFALARRAYPNARLVNAYGMTETGGPACEYDVDPDNVVDGEAVPVGRPFPGVRIDIVDEDGRAVGDGEPGEIRVAAPRVALGYWNQPALTAERFSVGADGLRAVRTGDRGRFLADGTLEVLGRADRRVKVHGQLVDLAEVEQEVERLPEVRRAVVSSVPADDGRPRVVAHVVLERDRAVTIGELRRGLADRLPPYAIPRAFFRVDDVPTAITGKVDRAALRESAVGALPLETEYVAPRTDRERAVAELFEEVLALDRVGVHDDFFELGGDSLSAVELLAGLSDDLGLDVAAGELLDHATVEALARRLVDGERAQQHTVVPVNHVTGPHLFCVPGAADTPLQYRALGRRLTHVSVHTFAYRGMDRRAVPDHTVAAIARRNVTALRAVDPTGPYRLLGYSFGGAVAIAMAQQLAAAGDDVELLALLEPSFRPPGGTSAAERSQAFADRAREGAPGAPAGRDPVTRARAFLRAGAQYVDRQVRLASAGIVPRRGLAQHDVFFSLHKRLLRAYRPVPYRGRTVVFASPRYLEEAGPLLDPILPPESAGGRRRDIPIAGEHLDLVREPNVADVAQALDLLLAPDPLR